MQGGCDLHPPGSLRSPVPLERGAVPTSSVPPSGGTAEERSDDAGGIHPYVQRFKGSRTESGSFSAARMTSIVPSKLVST